MITDGFGVWHYLAVKSIPALLRGVTSTHNGDIYCLNCFHSYRTRNKLIEHEKMCQVNDFCNLKLPNEENKYISSTPGKNTLKTPFIIYADLECLLVKMKFSEKAIHAPSGYSILTCYSFDRSLNEQKYYTGKDCMQNFSIELKSIFNKLINYEQEAMIPLTEDEKMLHDNQKVCSLCEKEFCTDKTNKKEYKLKCKVRDHCHFTGKYRGAAHSECNLRYKVSKVIPVVFHNGSSYDNNFVIKQLAKDFKGYFGCIGENTEKHISFSISVFKESDKKKKPDIFTLTFIDSNRFMKGKLENHVKNLAEPSKNLTIDVLQERFYNTCQLCPNDIERPKLLLRKGVFPYEHMNSRKRFDEPVPLEKKCYYSELNIEDISDSDLEHVNKVCYTFKINNLCKYQSLYVKSDVASLADVFENFRDKCLSINKLDPAYYLSAPGLS